MFGTSGASAVHQKDQNADRNTPKRDDERAQRLDERAAEYPILGSEAKVEETKEDKSPSAGQRKAWSQKSSLQNISAARHKRNSQDRIWQRKRMFVRKVARWRLRGRHAYGEEQQPKARDGDPCHHLKYGKGEMRQGSILCN